MPEELGILRDSLPFRPFDFFAQVVAVIFTCAVIPKFNITGILGPILLVIALGAFNAAYWSPSLFYALPETFSVRTAVLILINGGIFWGLVKILPNLEISGIFAAVAAPIVFSISSAIISTYGRDIDYAKVLHIISEHIAHSFAFLKHLVDG